LHQELDLAFGRLRQKPHLVRSFFAQAGLKLTETVVDNSVRRAEQAETFSSRHRRCA